MRWLFLEAFGLAYAVICTVFVVLFVLSVIATHVAWKVREYHRRHTHPGYVRLYDWDRER